MFDFKETSTNFGAALEATVRNLFEEYRPRLKCDIDEAIRSAEQSIGSATTISVSKLSAELTKNIDYLKQQADDSIRLAKVELSILVLEALTQFRRKILRPMVVIACLVLMVATGGVGFWMGRIGALGG